MIKSIDLYEPSSHLDLTFLGETTARAVGHYIATKLEPILGVGEMKEMCVADEESLVANLDRSKQYFEIHILNKSKHSYRVRQFLGSDRKTADILENLAEVLRLEFK